ncbi:MAG: glycosyltransferase family 4 protein [Verrucomicrobia bacterium]|nr:glycosyltransferase family 4 protein [Verrucomicrobiota bacterium]
MRVLFINRMLSLVRGGGETFDLEIGRHLARLGCRVSYLSGLPLFGGGRPPVMPDSFRPPPALHTVRSPYLSWIPWDRMRGGWRVWLVDRRMFERRALKWVLPRQQEYDIVHLCEMPDWVAAAKGAGLKVPVVLRLTGPEYVDLTDGLKAADGVIASGVSVEKIRASVRPDCENIPNSVDTDLFRPQPSTFRPEHGMGPDTCLILYVARFQDFKNHQMLVKAYARFAAEVPDSRLILAGEGHLKSWVQKDCVALGIADRVIFLGEVSFTDLPGLYAAADIKVISSDYESFSFATIEAMATGLPVATTDCAWAPRLIGQGLGPASGGAPHARPGLEITPGGVITPVKDPEALAKGLLLLARDPELRKKMGEWNRRKAVAEHGWAASAGKLLSLYKKLTGASSP